MYYIIFEIYCPSYMSSCSVRQYITIYSVKHAENVPTF